MAMRCGFCDTKTETSILVLPMRDSFKPSMVEFCDPCGDTIELTNGETGEVATLSEVYRRYDQTRIMEGNYM